MEAVELKIQKLISHYPQQLQEGINLVREKGFAFSHLSGKIGHEFKNFDVPAHSPTVISGSDLRDSTAYWFGASLTPCLFLTAVKYDSRGLFSRAVVQHLSARITLDQMDRFLDPLDGPEDVYFSLAGFAHRSDLLSLGKDSLLIVAFLNDFGFPCDFRTTKGNRHAIFDKNRKQFISDIGLALGSEDADKRLFRLVALGITRTESLMISVRSWMGLKKREISLITRDQGVVEIPVKKQVSK
jgi:hypothetical protein